MAQACPLIFRQVDATVVRINTLFVFGAVSAFLITHAVAILVVLAVDFLLRLYGYKHISPVQNLSLLIQEKLTIPSKLEDAGAKRLAAFFGLGFTIALAVVHLLAIQWAVTTIATIYLACAGMELLFGYCVGCKIYYIVRKIFPKAFA